VGEGVNRRRVRRRGLVLELAFFQELLLALLLAASCAREAALDPICSRPALSPGDPGRLAFTARGQVWIAERAAGGRDDRRGGGLWRGRPLAGGLRQDRPVWLPGGMGLAFSAWFAASEEADVAVHAAGRTVRLTTTASAELLCDVAPDGRLLFERDGQLVEMAGALSGRPTERVVARGRDGRYTPDGRHVLFVRGNESEPLGRFREGYQGGDDSDLYLLDLATLAVTSLTDSPGNDECPLPFDDGGRRFIVCRERGGPYRPWFVRALSDRIHRVHRLPMPEGAFPILFPAVRATGEAEIELVAEADGHLVHTVGAIGDTGMTFAPATLLRIRLEPSGLDVDAARSAGGARFDEVATLVTGGQVTGERWRAIPARARARVRAEMERTADPGAADELLRRLLGRLGLPGIDLVSVDGQRSPVLPSETLADSIAGVLGAGAPAVLDLRGARGGDAGPESLAAAICASGPILVLVDERTYGGAELLAERLRGLGCARLVGRPTAGAVVPVQSHRLAAGGTLVLPLAVRAPSNGGTEGVVPDVYVPPREDPAAEPWLAAALRAARGRGN